LDFLCGYIGGEIYSARPINPIKLGAARNKLPAAAAFAPHTPNDYYDCCRIDSVSHNAAADFMRG